MTPLLRLSACLLMTAVLAACDKSEPAASGSTATPAAAPATPAADETASAPAATAPAADDTVHVTLDMGKVHAWMQAQKNLAAAEKADPKLDAAQNVSEEDLAQYTARLEASPAMRTAIESAHLSVGEFARIGDTLLGAMMAQGALEAGQLKTIPDGIDPAAVEFVKQHKAELGAMMKGGGEG